MLQRIAAALFISVQALTIAYMPNMRVFAVAAPLVAFLGAFSPVRLNLSQRAQGLLLGAIGFAFLLSYLIAPPRIALRSVSIGSREVYVLAQFLIAVQILQLYLRRPEGRLPTWLLGVGTLCMVFGTNVAPITSERTVFLWLTLSFAATALFYIAASRRQSSSAGARAFSLRSALAIGAVAGALALGWTASTLLYQYQRQLEDLFQQLAGSPRSSRRVGFSGRAKLSSVTRFREEGANNLALRITSETQPSYLRGAAFDTLTGPQWQCALPTQFVSASPQPPLGLEGSGGLGNWLTIDKAVAHDWQRFDVRADPSLSDAVFSPLGMTVAQTLVESAQVNEHGVLRVLETLPQPDYVVFVPEHRIDRAPTGRLLEVLAQPVVDLDPAVATLASTVCQEFETTAAKIAAIEGYFAQNYEYRAGIDVPPGEDPLTYFLLERPPAHCEYFATGAAVLLRQCGVPCRYVTGFVVSEQNEFSGDWIARNKDAHAWVEAWDDERGWVIVEATPHSGVPTALEATSSRHLWEHLRDQARLLWAKLRRGDVRAVAQLAFELLRSPPALVLFAIVAGLLALRMLVRKVRSKPRIVRDPQFADLARLLDRMDRRLRARKLTRQTGETLHQFAGRIGDTVPGDETMAAIADWYRDYASLRYAGQSDGAALKRMQERVGMLRLTRR